MNKIVRGRFTVLKTGLLALAVLAIAGCGGSDDNGVGGGDPAGGCVAQNPMAGGIVDITNTCADTIIVLVDNNGGTRFVLEPGATNRVTGVGSSTGYGACFAPSEPRFTGALTYECT